MTDKSVFEQNVELWEKFVNTNMDLMFKTMEKVLEGSKTFQEQVGKAVNRAADESSDVQDRVSKAVDKALEGSHTIQEQVATAVNTTVSAQLEASLTILKALERQVERLSEKVDDLTERQRAENE